MPMRYESSLAGNTDTLPSGGALAAGGVFIAAMPAPQREHSVGETIALTFQRSVEGLIAAAPRETLTWREAEGTWNCIEVLCHLADGEVTDWIPRVMKILKGGGRFTPFDREGGFQRYKDWSADALVGYIDLAISDWQDGDSDDMAVMVLRVNP